MHRGQDDQGGGQNLEERLGDGKGAPTGLDESRQTEAQGLWLWEVRFGFGWFGRTVI